MLQQHSSLKTIKKKLILKALDMIRKIAEEDPDEYSNKDKTGNGLNAHATYSIFIIVVVVVLTKYSVIR